MSGVFRVFPVLSVTMACRVSRSGSSTTTSFSRVKLSPLARVTVDFTFRFP